MQPAPGTYQIRGWNNELLPYHLDYWLTAATSVNAPRFVYIDGFAGPGVVNGNRDGAPVIAYKAMLRHQSMSPNCPEIFIIFIEADQNNCESLLLTLQMIREGNRGIRNAEKVKFMVIHSEFTKALEWILSDGFAFYESTPSAIFKAPTSERFITRSTPTLIFTDIPRLDYTIPVPLIQKFTRMAGMGGMLIADFADRVLNNPIGGSIVLVDGEESELWQVIVFIGEDDVVQTYILLF